MPTEAEHLTQARHNMDILNSFCSGTVPYPTTAYPDWAVTLAFYTVVHLVEARLAQYGIHSTNHLQRNNEIQRRFRPIWRNYNQLQNNSRRARYEFIHPTLARLRELINEDLWAILNYFGVP